MNKIEITVPLAQAIVNYLQTKPYGEVSGLIEELTKQAREQSQPVTPKPVTPVKEDRKEDKKENK